MAPGGLSAPPVERSLKPHRSNAASDLDLSRARHIRVGDSCGDVDNDHCSSDDGGGGGGGGAGGVDVVDASTAGRVAAATLPG